MSNMEELRYLTDVANDPALANAKRKFKKGVKKLNGVLKKKLKKGTRKSSEFKIKRIWQRDISGNQIVKYEQFDPELATICVVSVRPESLGGDVILVDGQHTGMMDIFGECNQDLDTLELHHSPDATIEEVEEAEARLYKALNTQQKKLSKLDIIRVDIFLDLPYALQFETILKACNLNVDGIGSANGDLVPGSGARLIKTIEQFSDNGDPTKQDYSSYIVKAVNFMRTTWGSEESPLKEIRDDMIHGLTTLFVFLDYVGKINNGSPTGLNGKKHQFLVWMNNKMGDNSMRTYYNNSAGGNTHFKIVHNIINVYNSWVDAQTITPDFLHKNGIFDPTIILEKKVRKNLPSFPSDIEDDTDKNVVTDYITDFLKNSTNKEQFKYEQTQSLLAENFDIGEEFTSQQAFDFIYPIRSQESDFKNEDSFKGTILRELQELQKKGVIHFHANEGRAGRYSRLS